MKKLLFFPLLILALLLLLSACKTGEGAPPPSEEDPPAQGALPEPGAWESGPDLIPPDGEEAPPPTTGDTPELEETDWPALTTDADTFQLSGGDENPNFRYIFEHIDTVPLDQLAAFVLVADGLSEGACEELRTRFLEAPHTVLAYLELLGDQITTLPGWEPMPTAEILCRFIATADAAWHDGSEEFTQTMDICRETYQDGRISELLDVLETEHAASLERNHISG